MSTGSRLQRSRQHRVLAGVAGGLARDLGASPGAIRVGFVLLTWFYLVGAIVYVALWIAMPSEPEPAPAGGVAGGALRKVDGGLKLVRQLVGVVAGLVGILKVALPLYHEIPQLAASYRGVPTPATVPGPIPTSIALPAESWSTARRNVATRTATPLPPRPTPVAAPTPVDHTVRDGDELRALIARASQLEAEAMQSLATDGFHDVFAGEALEAELAAVEALRQQGVRRWNELLDRRFGAVASDGRLATVRMIEWWRSVERADATGLCAQYGTHAVPQTVHLARTDAGWRVFRITFDPVAPPAPEPCAGS